MEVAQKEAEEAQKLPIPLLVSRIYQMTKASIEQTGSKDEYTAILTQEVGDPSFRCNTATEDQREQVEIVYNALLEKGYTFKDEE